MEFKVTARAVAMFEKETGILIQDLMDQVATGRLPKIETFAAMIKHASKLSTDEAYGVIDSDAGVYAKVVSAYADWIKTAFAVADSGNSEASTSPQS